MKIACIGNITYDFSVSKKGFIKEGFRNNFSGSNICPGGPASNAAYLLAKYGNNVDLYGQIGKDQPGKFVYDCMKRENINLKHLNISHNSMTPYSFIINNDITNTRTICSVRDEEEFQNATIENIEYEKNYDYILTDGKYYEESIRLITSNPNAISVIDAGRLSREMLMLCNFVDYIVCSEDFANDVTERELGNDLEENIDIYKHLKEYFPFAEKLVITLGDKGYMCEKEGEVVIMPAFKSSKKTVDTTGAGDIFHGAFLHALANGYSFNDSLEFANITASLSTTKKGARYSCPELDEINKYLNNDVKRLIKRK